MKLCTKCKLRLPLDSFYKDSKALDKHTSACKACMYQRKKPVLYKSVLKKQCRSCLLVLPNSEFFKNAASEDALTIYCKICSKNKSRASKFKISQQRLNDLLSHGCEACGSFEKLCIDHDHSCCSGQSSCGECIRGVLCYRCNTAEGFLETVERAESLIEYMKMRRK